MAANPQLGVAESIVEVLGELISGGGSAGTRTTQIIPQNTTVNIPVGATWTVSVLSGTITLDGASGLGVGFSDSGTIPDNGTKIAVTTAAASTCYLRYEQ